MKKLFLFAGAWLLVGVGSFAQETFPVNDVKDSRPKAYAFKNANIFKDYQTQLLDATLLIRDGKVEAIGTYVNIPAGYVTVDLKGKYIYPSMIDMHTNYGMPEVKRRSGSPYAGREQIQPDTEGPYNANEAIKSQFDAAEAFTMDKKAAATWREMGFGSVLSFRPDGIARGSSAIVTLGETSDNEVMIHSKVAAHYSFDKGSSSQSYPSSAMGYIALLRQTYMDAEWYQKQNPKPFTDKSLDAWLALQGLPQIFEVNSWINLLRADQVGDEFGVQYIIKGGGNEYQRIDEVKATKARVIVPINFPNAYNVEDPIDAYKVSLANMKHWELAPANPGVLEAQGIEFALTTDGLKNKKDFWKNLRKALDYGLSEAAALKALTHTPANMLQMQDQLGDLNEGKIANFIITSSPIFEDDVIIYENWIQGKKYQIADKDLPDLSGKYMLSLGDETYELEITGKPGKEKAQLIINDTTKLKAMIKTSEEMLTLNVEIEETLYKLSGWVDEENLSGRGTDGEGKWLDWKATYEEAMDPDDKDENDSPGELELGQVIYPFVAYGTSELPEQNNMLIKNATVWTMEEEGKLENADVRVENGKISQVGQNLNANGAIVIDGTGKHLTPGIIDEHSHIAAASINDVATNSSMVRISDVIESDDQEIYRALSGGVTAIQILHGSANPIGGQSALIKLRWGKAPEDLKIKDADGYIKFALGENVKRTSNSQSIRYPQTRMGVEQVLVDAFTAALDYQKEWAAYNALSFAEKGNTAPPRKDLVHEAMLEILNGERFISCHSYVQSEINMLMKVAERFGFKVNTFTHILEGYKVADKMAEHGAGGSTFSDWWAYKWEVRYAIPYNAAIMQREGVVTTINSDDAEMMRRLNQEAAKSIKYGDIPEEDALAMVTINSAKLLHLDDRMGSIKKGKDADLVLWSDHPLSIYARAEKTIVDGTVYFDIEEDQKRKYEIKLERARLIEKMKDAKSNGVPTQMASRSYKHHWGCEDVVIYRK